jgi:hypothetical protein
VQCSAVQCSAVQCSAVQCSAVQCSAVEYGAVHTNFGSCLVRQAKLSRLSRWAATGHPAILTRATRPMHGHAGKDRSAQCAKIKSEPHYAMWSAVTKPTKYIPCSRIRLAPIGIGIVRSGLLPVSSTIRTSDLRPAGDESRSNCQHFCKNPESSRGLADETRLYRC